MNYEIDGETLSDGQVRQLSRFTLEKQNGQCAWCDQPIDNIGGENVLYVEYGEAEEQTAEVLDCVPMIAALAFGGRVWELEYYFTDEEPEVTA